MKICAAQKKDNDRILKILDEANLRYPFEKLSNFWVAEKDDRILGVVRLEDHPGFFFLTSLGVDPGQRNKGVAATLLKEVLNAADKPVYLYTIIPDFFKKFGFKIEPNPPQLPPKEIYGCDECFPGKCVVMKK
jgi:N-acetylglutamate synthase-like GNAT family acetyltransferase